MPEDIFPSPESLPNRRSISIFRGPFKWWRVLLLAPSLWKRWWNALVRTIDHGKVLASISADASFSFNYAFMVTIAAGIATIGLLFNSPAVIIGAMLISPLMGPIVGCGFAIAGFDVELGKRGVKALMLGALGAVAFATAIVLMSPIKEVTPEILARTRPNLFDLAVAILSGAAGAYGTIRGRGGAIVGVAIATALMPPLAVFGYGLATAQWYLARGALLLFITNMVAITVAVAGVAEWYGFGYGAVRKRFARQALFSLLILAPLIVPLFISLKSIAWESRVNATVRSVLEAHARQLQKGQLAQVQVRFDKNEHPLIEAIIVSEAPQRELSLETQNELQHALGVTVDLRLTQLQANDPKRLDLPLGDVVIKKPEPPDEQPMGTALQAEIPFPITAISIDEANKTAIVVPRATDTMGLSAWHEVENQLGGKHSDWHVLIMPPATSLPLIQFPNAAYTLDDKAEAQLQTTLWALQRWHVKEIQLIGHASSLGRKKRLAQQRVAAVADWFAPHGIVAREEAIYPNRNQTIREQEIGEAAFRSVEITLGAAMPTQPPSPPSSSD